MTYLTVPNELLGHAEVVATHLSGLGYRIRIEPKELAYPFAPTWTAKRQHTNLIVELLARVEIDRIDTWVRYAKACEKDTRVLVAIPDTLTVKPVVERALVELGVGVIVCSDLEAYERLSPKDQSIAIKPPALQTLPVKVRSLLAPTYEQLARGDWREGFRSAAQVLEVEAREHLKTSVARNRVRLVDPKTGKVLNRTPAQVEKLPAGGLIALYGKIASPNLAESIVEQALRHINEDRIRVVHHQKKASTETRLRRNVGKHMFVIINALKALRK